MSLKLKISLSLALSIVLLSVLFVFRSVPVSRLWNGYQVVYVSSGVVSEETVYNIFIENGCDKVISRVNQEIPLKTILSEVHSLEEDEYLLCRNNFFTDETSSSYLFYVPDSQTDKTDSVISALNAIKGVKAGIDSTSSFPWPVLFIFAFFVTVLIIFAANKALYAASVFPFAVFVLCHPVYTCAGCCILSVFGFYLIQKLYGRSEFVSSCVRSVSIISFICVPGIVLFVSSPLNSLFYFVASVTSFLLVSLVTSVFSIYYEKRDNKFIFIRSARLIPVINVKEFKLMTFSLVTLAVLLSVNSVSGKASRGISTAGRPALPSPDKGAETDRLSDLNSFYQWAWNDITFPYKKLSDKVASVPAEGESIVISDYIESDGLIKEVKTTVYVYDDEFKKKVSEVINASDSPCLEKMLLLQGQNVRYGYSKSSGKVISSEKFTNPVLIVLSLVTAFFCIYFMIGRRRYGLSF